MYAERFPDVATNKYVLIETATTKKPFARRRDHCRSSRPRIRPAVIPVGRSCSSTADYLSQRTRSNAFLRGDRRAEKQGIDFGGGVAGHSARQRRGIDYGNDLKRLDIADIVRLESGIDYLAAIQEMLSVDGLLLLQAANCNAQVPAKLYEYVRANRPILALTDPIGDTAATLNKLGAGTIAKLDSTAEIEAALLSFIEQIAAGSWRRPTPEDVSRCSRHAQARALAAC